MSDMRRMMMMFTRPVDSGEGGEVPTPTILPASGSISSSQTISISVSGIAISAEYSTDNVSWVTYTTPFTLSGNTTVYARAIDGDGNYSSVVSNSYTVINYDSRVEYLQGTGNTTWINTNFIPTQNDLRIIIDAENTVNGDFILYSIQGTNPSLNIDWYNRTRMYFRYRDYNTYFTTTQGRHIIENGANGMKIDGNVLATPSFSASYTFVGNTKKIVIPGVANAAEPTYVTYAFTGKIYEFWIYYGDELKLHFIPVRKNGVGYMYDTVSGELFGNSGSGTFTYGNDVTT